jgi:predicted nucleic acid-binding protein
MNTGELVVDASLALKWVVEEPYSAPAKALLQECRVNHRRLIAPALLLYEATNAIAKRDGVGNSPSIKERSGSDSWSSPVRY